MGDLLLRSLHGVGFRPRSAGAARLAAACQEGGGHRQQDYSTHGAPPFREARPPAFQFVDAGGSRFGCSVVQAASSAALYLSCSTTHSLGAMSCLTPR